MPPSVKESVLQRKPSAPTFPIPACSAPKGCLASCRNAGDKIGCAPRATDRARSLASQSRTPPTQQTRMPSAAFKANPATTKGEDGKGKGEEARRQIEEKIVHCEGQNAGQKSGEQIWPAGKRRGRASGVEAAHGVKAETYVGIADFGRQNARKKSPTRIWKNK